MITIFDRFVASSCSMVSMFYFMSATVAWYRVFFPKQEQSKVWFDRAIAWLAFAILFAIVATVRLDYLEWDSYWTIGIFTLCSLAIVIGGLMSVRIMTFDTYGNGFVVLFGLVSISAGLLVFLV